MQSIMRRIEIRVKSVMLDLMFSFQRSAFGVLCGVKGGVIRGLLRFKSGQVCPLIRVKRVMSGVGVRMESSMFCILSSM